MAPNAMNFFTVSGLAATRVSPLAVSFRTAIRIGAGRSGSDSDDDECRDQHSHDRTPLHQAEKARVGRFVCVDVITASHSSYLCIGVIEFEPFSIRHCPGAQVASPPFQKD
jgi:hypothetical protein